MLRRSPGMGCTAQKARQLQLSLEMCVVKSGGMEPSRYCLVS